MDEKKKDKEKCQNSAIQVLENKKIEEKKEISLDDKEALPEEIPKEKNTGEEKVEDNRKENKESLDSIKEETHTENKDLNKDLPVKTLEETKNQQLQEIKNVEPQEKKKGKKGLILIVAIVLIVILLIASTIFAVINITNTKIMQGISVGKIDVSNLSKDQAIEKVNAIYSEKASNQIFLAYGEFETSVTYETLEVKYQIDSAATKAYNIGRSGNIFKDNIEIFKAMTEKPDIELEVTIDGEMISQIAQNINNSIEGAVEQSSYYIEGNKLIITSGKEGLVVDEKQLLADIYIVLGQNTEDEQKIEIPVITAQPEEIDIDKIHQEIYKETQDAYYTTNPFTVYPEVEGVDFDVETAKTILSEEKQEYEIPLIITKPGKTVKDFGTEAFPDRLATFSTNYSASNKNRTTNLRLAAQKINGTILSPGEEFSYNKVVGERTIQAGYKEAAVYSDGQVVNGLGGGICQISSTLYDAVVMANLNVTTRRNHQFVTSYLPAGKDATVVYGSQDFKFVNTRKHPIRIETNVSGGVATITIWGHREEVEYDISIETKKTATISYTTQYIEDASLPAGHQVVVQAGSNGRKVEAYKVMRLNGQVVSTTLLSKDTYNAMKRIVRVGTGR